MLLAQKRNKSAWNLACNDDKSLEPAVPKPGNLSRNVWICRNRSLGSVCLWNKSPQGSTNWTFFSQWSWKSVLPHLLFCLRNTSGLILNFHLIYRSKRELCNSVFPQGGECIIAHNKECLINQYISYWNIICWTKFLTIPHLEKKLDSQKSSVYLQWFHWYEMLLTWVTLPLTRQMQPWIRSNFAWCYLKSLSFVLHHFRWLHHYL